MREKYTKINALDSREMTSLPKSQNVMNMARHYFHGLVCLTTEVFLIKILIFFDQ